MTEEDRYLSMQELKKLIDQEFVSYETGLTLDIKCLAKILGLTNWYNNKLNRKKGDQLTQPIPQPITEEQVRAAIQLILSDTAAYETSLNWAIRYAEAALALSNNLTDKTSINALKIQCLYILNNITGWRHPSAPLVRQTLKAFAKDAKESKDTPKPFASTCKEVLCKQRTSHLFLKTQGALAPQEKETN